MEQRTKHLPWLVWAALASTILAIVAAFALTQLQTKRSQKLPVLFTVPDFTLTNQHGRPVTLADLRGQVWLADIIFTRCAGPCPRMTRVMSEIQAALPGGPIKLVTLTTDPEFDTPEVLRRYARDYAAQPDRWHLLTGTKPAIARLAVDGLKLTALEKPEAERTDDADLFIHSTLFVLVDSHGRVRATFEGLEPGAKTEALRAVQSLLREK